MKKIILAVLMTVTTLSANAQLEKGHFMLTPTVGAGPSFMSNFQYADLDGNTKNLGNQATYMGTLDAQYNVSIKVGISLGLGWLYYESEKVTDNVPVTCQTKLSYLTVPVLAHYQFTKNLSAKAGIQTSFLLLAKNGAKTVTDDTKSVNVTIPIGLTWTFKLPFEVGIQYNIPVQKVNKEGSQNMMASGLRLTLGYRFSL